jgi:hypothetical protein
MVRKVCLQTHDLVVANKSWLYLHLNLCCIAVLHVKSYVAVVIESRLEGVNRRNLKFITLRLSPATSSIYILYIRPLQFSLKDSISYIYFLSNNVL